MAELRAGLPVISKKRHKNVIFHPYAQTPKWIDLYQIWFRGPFVGVINCAEFCCSRLMGFDSVRVQNSPSPIDSAGRR